MEPINKNWSTPENHPDGGISTGIGYTIAWQKGPRVENGRNGAFLTEVLDSCVKRLEFYQESEFACDDNAEALEHLCLALDALNRRIKDRESRGVLGVNKH